MVGIGYTMMSEQAGPKQLVADAVRAEEVGFDLVVTSDHFNPWLVEQGHSPYAWSVLGAVAHATERVDLMTYVTCPTMRYHPAIVAQKAATIALLSDGRFTLGLGAGENLNEHVVGGAWPPVDVRHEMLRDALHIIGPLFAGETVTYRGEHLETEAAHLWDRPDTPPPVGIAVSGPRSVELAAEHADVLIAIEPDPSFARRYDELGGRGARRVGQIGVSYDTDEAAAVARAHEQFRWFSGGWKVNSELPGPPAFAAASQYVRPEDVAESMPCGPDVGRYVDAVREFVDAGFTDVVLVQVGADHQAPFFEWAEAELLPALRSL
jgi:G6PDH family F420-dependent oxidoreductase